MRMVFGFLLVAVTGGLLAQAAHSAPALDGVWYAKTPVKQLHTADGGAPPLLPEAQRLYAQRIALMQAGDTSYDTSATACKPQGEPRNGYDGMPFEIVQGDDQIMFGYTWNRMVRFIDLKEKFDPIPGPMYYGTSIAHRDGNTLVVKTRDLNDRTLLDAAGMPHSDALQLTERFQLRDGGNTLRERIHFDDPKIFSRPWDTVITYTRMPGARIASDFCLERLHITLKSPLKDLPQRTDGGAK